MNNLRGNCLTELRLLQALDEELPLSEVWLVKLHLESCASCQARLEELQLVSSRVSELHQLVVPRDTAGPFAAQLAEEESRVAAGTGVAPMACAPKASVAAACLVWSVRTSGPDCP